MKHRLILGIGYVYLGLGFYIVYRTGSADGVAEIGNAAIFTAGIAAVMSGNQRN